MNRQEYERYHPNARYNPTAPLDELFPIGKMAIRRWRNKYGHILPLNKDQLTTIDPVFARQTKKSPLGRRYRLGGIRQGERRVVRQAYPGGPTMSRFELKRLGLV